MKNYQVGYSRVDITPEESVPLAGFGNTSARMSKCVRDPLYASCFAITDEAGTTVLLMSLDLQRADYWTAGMAREKIEALSGIPQDRIIVCGTHTHAGPDLFNEKEPSIARYKELLEEKLPLCAQQALADRKEAEIFIGQAEAEGMNFVKHYWGIHKVTGERIPVGDNVNDDLYSKLLEHITQSDPTIHVVKFVREGCRDLVLANFRAHGLLCSGTKLYNVSADWMGGLREEFEKKSDGLLTYFQGASGNQNPHSRIPGEEITRDCMAYGKLLADKVLEALAGATPLKPEPIKTKQVMFEGRINHPTPEKMEQAKKINAFYRSTGDRKAAMDMAREHGFSSYYHTHSVEMMENEPETDFLELNAVTMGELAFVSAPCELFDTLSVYVEDHAPVQKVITLGYANGIVGYMPSKEAFQYRCYEADCCFFAPGTGEQVRDCFLDMLNELKNA